METISSTSRNIGWVATVLVVVGALNWALVGLFSYDIVAAIFGNLSPLSRVIYVIIGAAGVYLVFFERALARDAAAALRPRSVT